MVRPPRGQKGPPEIVKWAERLDALCGTVIGYGAMRCAEVRSRTAGTGASTGAGRGDAKRGGGQSCQVGRPEKGTKCMGCYAMSGTDLVYAAICLRTRYAMPGTDGHVWYWRGLSGTHVQLAGAGAGTGAGAGAGAGTGAGRGI
eukprot:3715538-Rhodomonas_salina.1